jgi:hypothetical protein
MTEQRIDPLYDRFERALEDGDLGTAREYAVRIGTVQPAPTTVIESFERAIQEGADDRARTLLHTATRRFEEETATRARALGRSRLARGADRDLTGAQRRELTRHSRQAAAAAAGRAEFLGTAGAFLDPAVDTAVGRSELLRTVQRGRVRETTAREAADAGTEVTAELSLPGHVAVLAVQAPTQEFVVGASKPVTVTLGNLGDEPVEGATVTLTGSDGLAVDPGTATLDTLDGRGESTVEATVTADETGEHSVAARVEAGEAGTDADQLSLGAYEEAPTLAFALDRSDTGSLTTDEIQRALRYYENDEPVPNTGGERLTTEDIRRLIAIWATDQPV